MGVLGRRTRGEPTNRLSERTSQPPPSTTSGHCLRVRPGSPITYVHDKVGALKHPTVPAPPAAWSPPRTVSTETSTALAIRQMSLLQKNTPPNPISIFSLLNIPLRRYLRGRGEGRGVANLLSPSPRSPRWGEEEIICDFVPPLSVFADSLPNAPPDSCLSHRACPRNKVPYCGRHRTRA